MEEVFNAFIEGFLSVFNIFIEHWEIAVPLFIGYAIYSAITDEKKKKEKSRTSYDD